MPGKKKKSVKSKSKKKDVGNASESEANKDETLSGKPASAKKGGKKKKKAAKLSANEKLMLKLEKGVDALKANKYRYEHFIQVADTWLCLNGHKITAMLRHLDVSGDEVVSYEEFKSALFDKDCPINHVECHLLCRLLDGENTGDIPYINLHNGLRWYMKKSLSAQNEESDGSDEEDDDYPDRANALQRGQSAKDINQCQFCKIGLWTPQPHDIKYVHLTMVLITFADTMKKHPCHFSKVVHTHLTIYGLIQLIRSEVDIQSSTIAVFRDRVRTEDSELLGHMTLEECGYEGRDWFDPAEYVLYYDYTSEFNDCPILMCDHYFNDTLTLS